MDWEWLRKTLENDFFCHQWWFWLISWFIFNPKKRDWQIWGVFVIFWSFCILAKSAVAWYLGFPTSTNTNNYLAVLKGFAVHLCQRSPIEGALHNFILGVHCADESRWMQPPSLFDRWYWSELTLSIQAFKFSNLAASSVPNTKWGIATFKWQACEYPIWEWQM